METKHLTFSSVCIVINIVLGLIMGVLNIPLLFLDTIGTVFGAVVMGPLYGAAIGLTTNLVLGAISSPTNIPFALVNIAVGLIAGFIAKKFKFKLKEAIICGLILSIVCPLIGTPISILVFGGLSGSGADLLVMWLRQAGQTIFASTFFPRIASNLVDKVLTCVLVSIIITKLPKNFFSMKTKVQK